MENTEPMESNKKRKRNDDKQFFSCDYYQCEYIGSRSALHGHKASKHEGITFPCDKCNYVATYIGTLNRHKQTTHEGIKFPCDECEYSGASLSYLKKHQKIHQRIKYLCDLCETRVEFTTLEDHDKHVDLVHRTYDSDNTIQDAIKTEVKLETELVDEELGVYIVPYIKSFAQF